MGETTRLAHVQKQIHSGIQPLEYIHPLAILAHLVCTSYCIDHTQGVPHREIYTKWNARLLIINVEIHRRATSPSEALKCSGMAILELTMSYCGQSKLTGRVVPCQWNQRESR